MRVIAGTYRSRVLKEVQESTTRSTKDRVKESIFNSIQTNIYDSLVLDLFAGSGALGIEAISRGASHAVLNEFNLNAYKVVVENIDMLAIENATISTLDYVDFLISTKETFDIILLDPPYNMDVINEIVQLIVKRKILNDNGIIVYLYGKNNTLHIENDDIIEYKMKTIGITNVSYMKWSN